MARRGKYDPESLPNDYCAISIETAGYDFETGQIAEVAAVRIRDRHDVARFRSFVAIDGGVPEDLTKNAGLCAAHFTKAPSREQVIAELLDFVGDDTLVSVKPGRFVQPFLERDALRYLGAVIPNRWMDLLLYARHEGALGRDSLTDLCQRLGVEKEPVHRPLTDAIATHRAFEVLRMRAEGAHEIPDWLMTEESRVQQLGPDTERWMKERKHSVIWGALGAILLLGLVGGVMEMISEGPQNPLALAVCAVGGVLAVLKSRSCVEHNRKLKEEVGL